MHRLGIVSAACIYHIHYAGETFVGSSQLCHKLIRPNFPMFGPTGSSQYTCACLITSKILSQVHIVICLLFFSRFIIKFFFIIQMAYWIHCIPELYFQKIKKVCDWHVLPNFNTCKWWTIDNISHSEND